MTRVILRRLLEMIPVLLGVVFLTFVLFNVVGGSPASSVLGKNATALSLDDYDEQHGFNKPLLFGRRIPTRAFVDWNAGGSSPVWPQAKADEGTMRIATGDAPIPTACPLRASTRYEWTIAYRASGHPLPRMELPDGSSFTFATGKWTSATILFSTPDSAAIPPSRLAIAEGEMSIRSIRLRRCIRNPFDSQLAHYLGRLAVLDLGTSTETGERITTILRRGAGPSLCLTIPIFVGSLALSLLLALLCVWHRDRFTDRALVLLASLLMSINYVVWIVAGQYVFAFRLGWFPVWGFESWRYLLLPVLIGIVTTTGRDLRLYRSVMLEELYRDYVRTARAKGVGPAGILFRHVLRNAMIPVITQVSLSIPFLFTGSLLLESFFGIPGLGNAGINAIHASDMDVVRAIVLVGAALYMIANLAADLCYAWVDPRTRFE
jgi:peptide/nickel transport system permease protein